MSKLLFATGIVTTCLMSSAAFSAPLIIDGSGLSETVACTGNEIDIYGKNNTVKLSGQCDEIDIRGSGHNVTFEQADEIDVKGSNNKVTGGTVEEVTIKGESNQISATLKGIRDEAELDISGHANQADVKLESFTEIEVRGRSNKVTWAKVGTTQEPHVSISGSDNTVQQGK